MIQTLLVVIIDQDAESRNALSACVHEAITDGVIHCIGEPCDLHLLLGGEPISPDCILLAHPFSSDETDICLIETLRSRYPATGLIILTGSHDAASVVAFLHAGIDDCVIRSGTETGLIVATLRQVMEKKKNQIRNRVIEQRYQRLFDTAPIGLYRTTVDGELLDVNHCFLEMMGYGEKRALIGADASTVYIDALERQEWIDRLKRDGVVQNFQVRLRHRDGHEIWVLENARLTHESEIPGNIIEGSIQNITAAKKTMDALQVSERLYRRITESMSDIVCECDMMGIFSYISPSMQTVLGHSPQSRIGCSIFDLITTDHYDRVMRAMDDLQRMLTKIQLEVQIEKANGQAGWFDLVISPQFGDTGQVTGMLVRIRDISREKTAELEKESIHQQLLHSQKMDAVGRLAAGLAHDFKNILTAIRGYSDLILLELDEDHAANRDVLSIQTATSRAMALIRQLLIFSRLQPVRIETLDFNFLVDNLLQLLRRMIGEDVRFTLDLDETLDRIMGDPGSLEQIVLNLAVNARDAMKNGGDITIRTRNLRIEPRDIGNPASRDHSDFIALTVSDTGCGIPVDVLPMIFEPFFTTKAGKGTGLGLAVVYGIVKQHDGWIDVKSQPGQGTIFTVYLPADRSGAGAASEQAPVAESCADSEGKTVLVVEDEEDLRVFVERALRQHGYNVITARNGREAIDLFETHRDTVDLLFTDLILPDIHGLDVMRTIRNRSPDLRVLLTSGYVSQSLEWRDVENSGYQILNKPYLLTELLTRIRALFQDR